MAASMTAMQYVRNREYNDSCGSPRIFLRDRLDNSKNLYRKDLFSHYGCVNAIEFSSDGQLLASGGDDKRVLLWDVQKAISGESSPNMMKGEHNSNIFCLGFDSKHSKVFSAGNDEQVIVHDAHSGETCDVFLHDEAVYGLSVDPLNDNVFASACDNGCILIWDIREPSTTDPFTLARSSSAFHAIMYNPFESRLLASANSKEGVGLWDIRMPHCCLMKFGGCLSRHSSTSVRFNSSGSHLLALRRRLPPVLYNVASPYPVVEFDHPGYYNSCTMKSCCFAGDKDQYVFSGSDDFKLYGWKIPDEIEDKRGLWVYQAHLVLKAHRSIVNQVRYNSANCLLASSGVEKIVKLWSVFPLPGGSGNLNQYGINHNDPRKVYTHEEYMNLVMESGQFVTHDYSSKSIQEDPKMMAFFDSLVQRDIEGWTTDSSDSSIDTELLTNCFEVQSSPSLSSSPSASPSGGSSSSTSSGPLSSEDELTPNRSENRLTPHAVSYISALASQVQVNLHNLNGSRADDAENNRIAQLIAEKRHEQLLRAARTTLKLTKKRLKRAGVLAKVNNVEVNGRTLSEEEQTLDNARKILDSVLNHQIGNEDCRNKIRLLQKRKAKLWRGISDSETEESNSTQLENQTNGIGVESMVCVTDEQPIAGESDLLASHSNRNNTIALPGIVENGLTSKSDECVVSNGATCSTVLKDDSSQDSVDSVILTKFKRFKGKFGSRHYRSRDNNDE